MATNKDFVVKNGLVVGQNITVTGTITQAGMSMPASDGTAGQYLKTDGSGNLTWATVTSNFVIGDGSTTDTVNGGETLTFTGGTGIDATVTANTVTIDLNTNTDGVAEGSSNLYHTTARAISAIEGAAHLTIDGGTLYVDTSNNYVGIGDTSPSYPLDVAGAIGVNGSQVISSGGVITGAVADSALTIGGSLAGVLSNLKVQYGTAYSGTPIQGSFFFDSLNQKLKVYTGSAFVDAVPAGSGGGGGGGATDANTTFRNYSYTLAGTTSAVSGIDDNEIAAGAFIIGHKYTITTAGNTDFTAIGAADSNVNTVFTATGVGTGTGVATQTLFYDTTSSTTRVVAYVNGIKQVYGSGRDFVATTGTSVAFTYNLGAGDTVDLQVYELLTNAAYYLKSEVYTQTQVNSQISTGVSAYLPLAGGTLSGDLSFGDNNKAIFGAGSDLQIYHNGTDSVIKDAGTGSLEIHAENFEVWNASKTNVIMAGISSDGEARLYYGGSMKLNTSSTGIDVTGTVVADGLVVDGNATLNGLTSDIILQGNTSGSQDANEIKWRTTTSSGYDLAKIKVAVGSNFYDGSLVFQTQRSGYAGALVDRMRLDNLGDISFYEDTGTTAKFFWDASAESLGIGTSSPGNKVSLKTSAGGCWVQTEDAINTSGGNVNLFGSFGTGMAAIYTTGANPISFHTNAVERMRIDSSGRVTMPYQPAFSVRRSSTSVTSSHGIPNFDTVNHNIGSHYDISTNRFTAPVSGVYSFSGHVIPVGLAQNSGFELWIARNNTGIRVFLDRQYKTDLTGNSTFSVGGAASIHIAANDYVWLATTTASYGDENNCWFSGYLVG